VLSRIRASLGLIIGLLGVFAGTFLRLRELHSENLCYGALGFVLLALGAAWVARPERQPWLLLGTSIGAALLAIFFPILALLEPAVRVEMLPAAFEASGAFLLLASFIRWSQANAASAFVPAELPKKHKYELGEKLSLGPGDDILADCTILEGTGFVDEAMIAGVSLPSPKKVGDTILAGSDTSIPELVVRVESKPGESVIEQRERLFPALYAQLARPNTTAFFAAGITLVFALVASSLVVVRFGAAELEHYLPAFASILLATAAGPAVLAAIRGRLRVFAVARAHGLILTRERDVLALPDIRRWQIDASLLSEPGHVETVVLGAEKPEKLLRVAAALLEGETGPEAAAIHHAVHTKRLDPLPGAALRHDGSLYLGTVDAARWYLGPQRAVVEEQGANVDRHMEQTFEFLRDKGMIVYLIGRPGEGVVGAIGITLEADHDAKTAAHALQATVMPGPPDGTRKILAEKAGIKCDGPPVGKRDATLLSEHAPAPSAGLRIRVVPIRARMTLEADASPRVFLPSLGHFGEIAAQTKRAARSARVRSLVLSFVPGAAATVLAFFGVLSPLFGFVLAAIALTFVGRAKA
jgi:hypothetical protein